MSMRRDPLDESLTSLAWLQRLGCASGLVAPLQTPTAPPNTALARRYAQRTTVVLPTRSASNERPPTIKQLEATIRKEHEIPSDIDWSTETVVKPPHNFPTLIYMAIKGSKIGKVTLSEIYGYIQDHFQFYRDNDSGWKNSIRHNLTQNKFFVRSDRKSVATATTAKGGFWSLDLSPKFIPDFNRQVRRFGRSKGKTCGRTPSKGATRTSGAGKTGGKHSHKLARKKSGSDNKGRQGRRSPSMDRDASAEDIRPSDAVARDLAQQRNAERELLTGLTDESIFDDVYQAVRVSGEERTDLDSICSDVSSRGTGGSESMLSGEESSNGIGWIVDNAALPSSTLRASSNLLGTNLSRLAGEPASPVDSLNFDVEAFDVDCMLDLVSSFSISDEQRMLPTGGDLQVVGVGMSLLAPKDELELVGTGMRLHSPPPQSAGSRRVTLPNVAAAGPEEDFLSDSPLGTDWSA
eukprot:m.102020 g.102020  ORF g.102020 m.102020 type:complete len:464 (-) comp10420_c1_seq1:1970-3361(-)